MAISRHVFRLNRYCVCCLILMVLRALGGPVDSSFTYQGRLTANGSPATGPYALTFGLYDAAVDGNQVGILTNAAVLVTDGVFSTELNFGSAPFDGTALWLEIAVQATNSPDLFTSLTPRQAIKAAPYALFAVNSATPSQLLSASNSLQSFILQGLSIQSNSVVELAQSLSASLNAKLAATNGVAISPALSNPSMRNSFFEAESPFSPPAITIQSTGTNHFSGVTLQNGWWAASYNAPVAYFQPVTVGSPMPLDLMPKGSLPADTWLDVCDRDVSINNAGFWEAITVFKHADDYAEVGTKTIGGKFRDLYLQSQSVPYGGKLGIGAFDNMLRPKYMTQIRPFTNLNLGVGAANSGILLASINDRNTEYNPLTARASKILLSADQYGSPLVFFQVRPATNVNFSIDNVDGNVRFSAFSDQGLANIPTIYHSLSHLFTSDSGASYGMVFSNNLLTATAMTIGGNGLGVSQIFTLNSTNRSSQPWPAMMADQRDAIIPNPPTGSVILNLAAGQPELADGNGHWFRFGQRPALASTAEVSTVVTDAMDVLLVKGTGARSVILPDPGLCLNRVVEIKDAAFVASSGNITITSPSGKVENRTSLVVDTDGGAVRLVTDGIDWFKLN